jgi:hypothetical protein
VDRHCRIDPGQGSASTHHPEYCQLIAGHTTSRAITPVGLHDFDRGNPTQYHRSILGVFPISVDRKAGRQ